MIGPLGPEPNARSIGAPQACSVGLLRGHLEPLVSPQCMHAIFADVPALRPQEICHRAVPIPPVRRRQCDNPLAHPLLVWGQPWPIPIGGPELADRPTRPTLGHVEHGDAIPHGFAAAGRAQKFPEATSVRIERATAWSATIRLSRRCAGSKAFRRLA